MRRWADELAWSKEYLKGQVNGGEMPTPGALMQLYRISNGESMTKELNVKIPEKLWEGGEAVAVGLKVTPDAFDADDRDCVELANPDFNYQDGVNEIVLLMWKWNGAGSNRFIDLFVQFFLEFILFSIITLCYNEPGNNRAFLSVWEYVDRNGKFY